MTALAARNIHTIRKMPRESKLAVDSLIEIKARIEHFMRSSPSEPTITINGMKKTYMYAYGSTIGQAWLAPAEYIGQVVPGVIIMGHRTANGVMRLYEFDLDENSEIELIWNPGFLESDIPKIGYYSSGFVCLGKDVLQNVVHDTYQDIFHTACRILLITRPDTHEHEAALWAATHILHKHKCPLPGGPDSYLPSNQVREMYSEFIETLSKRDFRDVHNLTRDFKWIDGFKILLSINPTTSGNTFASTLHDIIINLEVFDPKTRPDPETEYARYMVYKMLNEDTSYEKFEEGPTYSFSDLAREIIQAKLFNHQTSLKWKDRTSHTDIIRFYETDPNGLMIMKEEKVTIDYACMTRPEICCDPQTPEYNAHTSMRGSFFTRSNDLGLVNVRDRHDKHSFVFNEISVLVLMPINTRFHLALDLPIHKHAVYDRLRAVPLDTSFKLVVAKDEPPTYHTQFDIYTHGDVVSNVYINGMLNMCVIEEFVVEPDLREANSDLELLPLTTLSTLGARSENYTMAVVGTRQDIIANILTGATKPARFTTEDCLLARVRTIENAIGSKSGSDDSSIVSMIQEIHSNLVDANTFAKLAKSVERMEDKIGSFTNEELQDVHAKHKTNTLMGVLSNMQNQLDMNGEGIDSTYDIMSSAIPSIEDKVTKTFTPEIKRALEELPGTMHDAVAAYSSEVITTGKEVAQIVMDMKRSRRRTDLDRVEASREMQNPPSYLTDQEAIRSMLEKITRHTEQQDVKMEELARTNAFLVENIGLLANAMKKIL